MILLKNFSLFSQFNKNIIQKEEAKVKKFFKIYPTKKEKTCGGDAGQSRGAGRGHNVKNFLLICPNYLEFATPQRGLSPAKTCLPASSAFNSRKYLTTPQRVWYNRRPRQVQHLYFGFALWRRAYQFCTSFLHFGAPAPVEDLTNQKIICSNLQKRLDTIAFLLYNRRRAHFCTSLLHFGAGALQK